MPFLDLFQENESHDSFQENESCVLFQENASRGSCPPAYLNVGLEVEVLLRPKDGDWSRQPLQLVTEYLSMNHNAMMPKDQRKMHSDLCGNWEGERFAEWSLTIDRSIKGGDDTDNICQCAA